MSRVKAYESEATGRKWRQNHVVDVAVPDRRSGSKYLISFLVQGGWSTRGPEVAFDHRPDSRARDLDMVRCSDSDRGAQAEAYHEWALLFRKAPVVYRGGFARAAMDRVSA